MTTSACTGSGDDPAAGAQGTGSGESPTPTESTTPTPTVTPAEGYLLEQPDATVNAPDGYTHMPDLLKSLDSAGQKGGSGVISLVETPGWRGAELAEAAETSRATKGFKPPPRRTADIELDGDPAYHLTGNVDRYTTFDEFGALRRGQLVVVEFKLDSRISAADRKELIASTLASFRWR